MVTYTLSTHNGFETNSAGLYICLSKLACFRGSPVLNIYREGDSFTVKFASVSHTISTIWGNWERAEPIQKFEGNTVFAFCENIENIEADYYFQQRNGTIIISSIKEEDKYLHEIVKYYEHIINIRGDDNTELETLNCKFSGEGFGAIRLVDLVFQQCDEHAKKIAVQPINKEGLSYGELRDFSEKKYSTLIEKTQSKPRAHSRNVLVFMDKSTSLISSILAILKANLIYLPVDTSTPIERIKFIISHSNPICILVDNIEALEMMNNIIHDGSIEVLNFCDANIENIQRYNCDFSHHDNTKVQTSEDFDTIYMMYTSGSTGMPKGVKGSNRATINRLKWMFGRYPFQEEETIILKTSIGFVDSIWEIFAAIASGNRLVVASNVESKDPIRLTNIIHDYKVTRLVVVPSLLSSMLLISNIEEKLRSLHYIVSSGEPLTSLLLVELKEKLSATILNLYGSTEVAGDVTFFDTNVNYNTSPSDFFNTRIPNFVPLGIPVDNTRIFILDRNLEALPPGVIGEICIAGYNLSNGYYHNDLLNARSFIQLRGVKLYRMGDLGFIDGNGILYYVGRVDNQIKIRGNRVELGEIEVTANRLECVKHAIVLCITSDHQNSYLRNKLVLFVVLNYEVDVNVIMKELSSSLPNYLVPSEVVILESFPTTVSGKIDKIAMEKNYIQTREKNAKEANLPSQLPTTETESFVLSVWCDVFGKAISIVDDFYLIGGESLMAFAIINNINKKFSSSFTIVDLLQNPTVSQLSTIVDNFRRGSSKQQLKHNNNNVVIKRSKYDLLWIQKSCYFQLQMHPDNIATNIPVCFWVNWEFDAQAFLDAFCYIVKRHEIFRSKVFTEEYEPFQTFDELLDSDIAQHFEVINKTKEWSALLPMQRQLLTTEIFTEKYKIPFTKYENYKVCVLVAGKNEYAVFICLSHMIGDGVSIPILLNELSKLYTFTKYGKTIELPEMTYQVSDYIIDTLQYLQDSEATSKDISFWNEQLEGANEIVHPEFIPDFPDENYQLLVEYQASKESISIGSDLLAGLKCFSKSSESTLFLTIFASFYVLLHRYTSAKDILIGTPIAMRNSHNHHLIGPFVNVLPVRMRIDGDMTFSEFLQAFKSHFYNLYSHSQIPLEMILSSVNLNRSQNFFHFNFVQLEERSHFIDEQLGMYSSEMPISNSTLLAQYNILFRSCDNDLTLTFEYPKLRYKSTSIKRILSNWCILLKDIVTSRGCKLLRHLDILDEAQKTQLLDEFNPTDTVTPQFNSFYEYLDSIFSEYPNSLAVRSNNDSITYYQLKQEISHFCSTLLERGIEQGTIIGVCIPKTIDYITVLLSIIRIGCCYVFVDTEFPTSKLQEMVNESKMKYIVCDEFSRSKMESLVDSSNIIDCKERSQNPLFEEITISSLDIPCLCLYTSGTSGKPKGYKISHKNMISLFYKANILDIKSNDVVACISNQNFDLCMFEIYSSLTRGSLLVLVSRDAVLDPKEFFSVIHKNKVNHISMTTSLFHVFGKFSPESFHDCVLYVGGEKINSSICELVLNSKAPPKKILNVYGPGELTYACSFYEITEISATSKVPLGIPMTNSAVYIVNSDKELQPIGVVGEICCSGPKITLGYFDSSITERKYIYKPEFRNRRDHEVLYMTGDLGYMRDDGILMFVGRSDFQVKIRGFRVDLSYIQCAIETHPKVNMAAVLFTRVSDSDNTLIAFITGTCTQEEIIAHLRATIQPFFIPSFFVFLPKIPLTSRGKVDQDSLLKLFKSEVTTEVHSLKPLSEEEQVLLEIFQRELQHKNFSIDDNFFVSGGHSLLAMKILYHINNIPGYDLSFKEFFAHPTVREIAKILSDKSHDFLALEENDRKHSFVIESHTLEENKEYPISFAQKRLWLISTLYPDVGMYTIPICIRLVGELQKEALVLALKSLLNDFYCLRSCFYQSNITHEVVQSIKQCDVPFVFEIVKRDDIKSTVIAEQLIPVHLNSAPLIRFKLLQVEEDPLDHYFILSIHHITSDRSSVAELLSEISHRYACYLNNELEKIIPPKYQYIDMVLSEDLFLAKNQKLVESELNYWEKKLKSLPKVKFPFPSVRASENQKISSFTAAIAHKTIPALQVKYIKAFASKFNTTPNIFLLAVLYILKFRYTNETDFSINTILSNRKIENDVTIVGFFVNTIIMRYRLHDPKIPFTQFFRDFANATLEDFEHSLYADYQQIAEIFSKLGENPLHQTDIVFTYYHYRENCNWVGLKASEKEFDVPILRFNVEFTIEELESGDLHICVVYNDNLYAERSIQRLIGHYLQLVQSILSDQYCPIDKLCFVTKKECYELSTFHLTTNLFAGKTFFSILLDNMNRNPKKIALQDPFITLTYKQFVERIRQFACFLYNNGIQPNSVIIVSTSSVYEFVISIYAINLLGCYFVPFDCTLPQVVLVQVISNLTPSCIICNDTSHAIFSEIAPSIPLFFYKETNNFDTSMLPQYELTLSKPGYLLLTSGSTGIPKPCIITEFAILSRFYNFYSEDVIIGQTSSLYFDPIIAETFGCHLAGGTLNLCCSDFMNSVDVFEEYVNKYSINALVLSTHKVQLLSKQKPTVIRNIKYLCVGGSVLLAKHINGFELSPDTKFKNLYGPTETTFSATEYTIDNNSTIIDPIPIGKPQSNTYTYIVDKNMQPLPIGIRGELVIGGPVVGLGYYNNPEMTRARFLDDIITDPQIHSFVDKLYITGDSAIYNDEGEIEFLSRIDSEVKFRGFRISCVEIEKVLLQHENIEEAFVMYTNDGNERLLLYFVGKMSKSAAKEYLQQLLPHYMVPTHFMKLKFLPKFPASGKVDKSKLPEISEVDETSRETETELDTLTKVQQSWRIVLGFIPASNIRYFECGGTSLSLMNLQIELKRQFNCSISLHELLQNATIESQVQFFNNKLIEIEATKQQEASSPANFSPIEKDIAIVGFDCNVPKSPSIQEYWHNLLNGIDCITDFEIPEVLRDSTKHFVSSCGVLEDCEMFDNAFFQMTLAESRITDPQHRVLLESCHKALEVAGIDPKKYESSSNSDVEKKKIGVFIGLGDNTYYDYYKLSNRDYDAALSFQLHISNLLDSAPTRVSYKLGTSGPSMAVQSACSSSLVAIHTACQSIIVGDCTAALAGGVSISFPQNEVYEYQEGMILSYDGRCKPFDKNCDGVVSGNGVGTVVLMKLSEAIQNGYHIYGVIRGSAVNNDGNSKMSYSSSSIPKHVEVIKTALKRANLDAESVQFIESHGAGTIIGDLSEVSAFSKVYQGRTALGSVKSNIGHLGAAAGVSGVVKVLLSLEHSMIPPTLHFSEFHPYIRELKHKLYVNTSPVKWKTPNKNSLKTAAVHSFGQGGTNGHLIIQEYPSPKFLSSLSTPCIFNISALTLSSLKSITVNLLSFLDETPKPDILHSISKTLLLGRREFDYRVSFCCSSTVELFLKLRKLNFEEDVYCLNNIPPLQTAYLFPGQGSQFHLMGKPLYDHFPIFKHALNQCNDILMINHKIDILSQIFSDTDSTETLSNTINSQLSTFCISYAFSTLLESFNIQPSIMIGHSLGEYTAACISGVFSLSDALHLVVNRAILMNYCQKGAMVAIREGEEFAQQMKEQFLVDIAAINAKNQVILSGEFGAIAKIIEYCDQNDIKCTKLNVSHAYHSKLMDSAVAKLESVLRKIKFNAPRLPIISTYTGNLVKKKEIMSPEYWMKHMRNTVLYQHGFTSLIDYVKENKVNLCMIEVGPGRSLSNMAIQRNNEEHFGDLIWKPVVTKNDSGFNHFFENLSCMWKYGVNINFSSLFPQDLPFIRLPTYPFEKVMCSVNDIELISSGTLNLRNSTSLRASIEMAPNLDEKGYSDPFLHYHHDNQRSYSNATAEYEIEHLKTLVNTLNATITDLSKSNLNLSNMLQHLLSGNVITPSPLSNPSQPPTSTPFYQQTTTLSDNNNNNIDQNTQNDKEFKRFQTISENMVSVVHHNNLNISVGIVEKENKKQVFHIDRRCQPIRDQSRHHAIFPIGCLSSVITFIILDALVEEGKLQLTDYVQDLIPESACRIPTFRTKDNETFKIQVVHLCSHTSGLVNIPANVDIENNSAPNHISNYSISEMLEYISTAELLFQPGSNCSYSILGTCLLCHILCYLHFNTKKSSNFTSSSEIYQELISKYISGPLGLKRTGLFPMVRTSPIHNLQHYLSQGYSKNGLKSPLWMCGPAFTCADGVYSTVHDMIEIVSYLLKSKSKIVTNFLMLIEENSWFIGLTPASSCWLCFSRKFDYGVIIYVNTEMEVSYELIKYGEKITRTLRGLDNPLHFSSKFYGNELFKLWNGLTTSPTLMNHFSSAELALKPSLRKLSRWDRPSSKSVQLGDDNNYACKDDYQQNNNNDYNNNNGSSLCSGSGSKCEFSKYERILQEEVAKLIGKERTKCDKISVTTSFQSLGLDSLQLISFIGSVSNRVSHSFPVHIVYEYPTIQKFAGFLSSSVRSSSSTSSDSSLKSQLKLQSLPPSLSAFSLNEVVLPLVIQPTKSKTVQSLARSLREKNTFWHDTLIEYGAILFRGFDIQSPEQFLELVQSFSPGKTNDYKDGISPRTPVIGNSVFTSTEYPKQYNMALHNEMSYTKDPPKVLFFYCSIPPQPGHGGETPIADSAKILRDLIEQRSDIVDAFKEKGIKYVTNLPSRSSGGLGLCWQQTYQTDDPLVVERFCQENNIQYEWIHPDSGVPTLEKSTANLRTMRTYSATRNHPTLNTEVWFNHSHLFHPSDLPVDTYNSLRQIMKVEMFPKYAEFGDGSEIPEDYLCAIRKVLTDNEIAVSWEAYDLLLIDNNRVCHGRRKFDGPRRILVSMI